ncbi:galactokinase [Paramicrobacterium chengjingii]|uniref:Galactokinase n=1 Tax=Paramicrobacterium chengjingii TaxID=2769067 RepID=A0ABX6YKH7_9MICO|nr:galactokinase [Microbacterium chengjingii]QPZ39276.1 galactokinase [Microbacterium chengjingii]
MTTSPRSTADSFAARYNRAPDGVWQGPGRVNLIGEHTDYNDGFVLPFAIDRTTAVAVAARDDRTVRVSSDFADAVATVSLDDLDDPQLAAGTLSGWSAYPFGVVWALRHFGADLASAPGFDAHVASDVPTGAGLSSSAALMCAIAVALNDEWQLGFDAQTLARVGQLAENKAVGAPTGIMDESASLFGRRDAAVFLDCRSLDSEVIDLGLEQSGLEILVMNTRVDHAHATGGYAARRASCEKGARLMGVASLRDIDSDDLPRAERELDDETFRRVRHIITENQRVLDTVRTLRTDGPGAIGALVNASHLSMRDDFEISVPELDLAVETAQANGAVGARMTGGGFGGAAVALISSDRVGQTTDAVTHAFADAGFREPECFTVHPADGAGRAL